MKKYTIAWKVSSYVIFLTLPQKFSLIIKGKPNKNTEIFFTPDKYEKNKYIRQAIKSGKRNNNNKGQSLIRIQVL